MANKPQTDSTLNSLGVGVVSCPACFGEGVRDYASCVACAGDGHSIVVGNHIAVISDAEVINRLHSAAHAAVWRTCLRAVLFAGAISSLIYAALLFVSAVADGVPALFLQTFLTGAEPLFFWVGTLCALFVYASIERDVHSIAKILRPQYKKAGKSNVNRRQNVYATVTGDARRYISAALDNAERRGQSFRPADLFLQLLSVNEVRLMLLRLGVRPDDLAATLRRQLPGSGPAAVITVSQVVLRGYLGAYYDRRERVDCTALFEATAVLDPLVRDVLYDKGIDEKKIRNVVLWQQNDAQIRARYQHLRRAARLRPRGRLDRAMTALATPLLDTFSEDITEQAQYGGTFPFVRRSTTIETVLRIFDSAGLPLLIGEHGIGKRGILEDFADRMMSGEVPAVLKDKRLVNLMLSKLVSGATPAEAASRILRVLGEARRSGNIVLAITGVHGVRGITSGQAGSVDLAEVLATGIRRMRLPVIGTTTPEEHRQYLVGSALGGIFEPVLVSEPTVEEAIPMVESHALFTESSRKVLFTYDAIERLVNLTNRFLPDKRLPKKAIELLDELALYVGDSSNKLYVVTAMDVDKFLSSKVDIPVRDVTNDESALLLHLEEKIHERFVDQEQAVSAVANAIRRARAEVRDVKRPIVNLLFLGPTGVGKTELAKTVAALYFGSEQRMIRIDMSEYTGADSVTRLAGGRGAVYGTLTSAVRAHPFSLVLLDELDKADTAVLNLFLQIMDDGRLTAGNGEVIDFTNVMLIATSNAGTAYIQDAVRRGEAMEDIERALNETVLRENFSPEFMNRFDAAVVFRPLTMEHIEAITKLLINKVAERMQAHGVVFTVTPEAVQEIAIAGYDPLFGARPLRRVIQNTVDSVLAKYLLEGKLHRRDTITLEPGGILRITRAE